MSAGRRGRSRSRERQSDSGIDLTNDEVEYIYKPTPQERKKREAEQAEKFAEDLGKVARGKAVCAAFVATFTEKTFPKKQGVYMVDVNLGDKGGFDIDKSRMNTRGGAPGPKRPPNFSGVPAIPPDTLRLCGPVKGPNHFTAVDASLDGGGVLVETADSMRARGDPEPSDEEKLCFKYLAAFLDTQAPPWNNANRRHETLMTPGHRQSGSSCPLWAITNALALVEKTARPKDVTEARAAFERLRARL